MKLTSNLAAVKGRLTRYANGLPGAVAAAIAPAHWQEKMKTRAALAMWTVWKVERDLKKKALYEQLANRLLATFRARGGGELVTIFSMGPLVGGGLGNGIEAPPDLAGAIDVNLGLATPKGRVKKELVLGPDGYQHWESPMLGPDAQENITKARQAVADWVRLEKNWQTGPGGADEGKTEEEVIAGILEILGLSGPPFHHPRTDAMDEAAASLVPAIQRWLDGEGDTPAARRGKPSAPAVDEAMIADWLQRVMALWTSYLGENLQFALRRELTRLRQRVQTELV